MPTSDTFVQDFQSLLGKIPSDISLKQLQYDYRQVAFLMAMRILDQFPEIMTGPPPLSSGGKPIPPPDPLGPPVRGPAPAGGPSLNPYPHGLCPLVCYIFNA